MAESLEIERLSGSSEPGVLCLRGPLTFENLQPFHNAIRREQRYQTVILDLTGVPYVDSSGLGSLVSTFVSRQKAGQRVALSGVNERVMKLFEITRVESLFLMFPTIDDALAALASAGHA